MGISYHLLTPFYFIARQYRRIKRLIKWIKVINKDVPWDASGIYSLMLFKLKEIEHALLTDEYSEPNKQSRQALRISIKILNRLENHTHSDIMYRRHDKKWGKIEWPKGGNIKRSKVITDEDYENERNDARAMYDGMEKWEDRDLTVLYSLLKKYIEHWWT